MHPRLSAPSCDAAHRMRGFLIWSANQDRNRQLAEWHRYPLVAALQLTHLQSAPVSLDAQRTRRTASPRNAVAQFLIHRRCARGLRDAAIVGTLDDTEQRPPDTSFRLCSKGNSEVLRVVLP